MNNNFNKQNRQRHINKLAQAFMCAMLSDGKWWDFHSKNPDYAVFKAFTMAEAFCRKEEERSKE